MDSFPTALSMANCLRHVRSLDDKFACVFELQTQQFTRFEIIRHMESAIALERNRREQIAKHIRKASAA